MNAAHFADTSENASCHPLFSSEKKNGVLRQASDQDINKLRSAFDIEGLLPGIELKNVCKVSLIIRYGTKFCKSDIIAFGVNETHELLPNFGEIKQI